MLTVREHQVMRIAAARYRYLGRRDTDAYELTGYTPTRFAQVVHALIERPDAIEAYPAETRRLRAMRDKRAAARSARRLSVPA